MTIKLNASIPANNWKIIELYNKLKKEELDPSPDFQRKLVWKKSHKFKFIETILLNFPFPGNLYCSRKIRCRFTCSKRYDCRWTTKMHHYRTLYRR